MRLFFYALIALMIAAPHSAFSADLFVKKPGTETHAPVAAPPPAAEPQPEATAPSGTAETIGEFATRYYKNCMSKQDAVLTGSDQQMLCTCSSQKLTETMTVDDVKTMATDTPEGQFQRNRLLLQVYAPCMEYPARALLLRNCSDDKKVQETIPNYQAACTCMADNMAVYVAANGPSVIAKSLHDNPTELNPLAKMMSSEEFQTKAKTELATCIAQAAAAPATPSAAPTAQAPTPQ